MYDKDCNVVGYQIMIDYPAIRALTTLGSLLLIIEPGPQPGPEGDDLLVQEWLIQCRLELSMNPREVLYCPEKATARAFYLLKAPHTIKTLLLNNLPHHARIFVSSGL